MDDQNDLLSETERAQESAQRAFDAMTDGNYRTEEMR